MIRFKAKKENRQFVIDGKLTNADCVKVPTIERRHCDMAAFRSSPDFGSYANSDLFPGMIRREIRAKFPQGFVLLDALPCGVLVNEGFLCEVGIHNITRSR